MRRIKTLRDALPGEPHPKEAEQTIRRVVDRWRQQTAKERIVVPGPMSEWVARMPGDKATHPLQGNAQNPYPGLSVLELSRMYHAGKIPLPLERQALAYIDQFNRLERLGDEATFANGARPKSEPAPEPKGPKPNWPGHHS